jgi:hypothetical protein
MQYQDYLLKQIEEFGKVLQLLLAKTMARGTNVSIRAEEVNTALKTQAGISLEDLLRMDNLQLKELLDRPVFAASNAEKLAELLVTFGEAEPTQAERMASQARRNIELIDQKEQCISLTRMALLQRIDKRSAH